MMIVLFKYPLLILPYLFLFFSCKEEINILEVSVSSIEIEAAGGTHNFTLTTDAAAWNIENPAPEWITLSKTSGITPKEIVSVAVNSKSLEPRSAVLTIKAENAKDATVTVSQAASDFLYEITASIQSLIFENTGGDSSFTLISTAPNWNLVSDADWLSLNPTSGSSDTTDITISIATNNTYETRTATVNITAAHTSPISISVTQDAAVPYTLTASKQSLDFKQTGGSSSFAITSSAPAWSLSSNADWLTISPTTSSTEITEVSVSATANTSTYVRNASISIQAPNAADVTIAVTQSGALYPSYNIEPIPADMTGMQRSATELAKAMTAGWNLGNTLEVPGSETGWGNPKATQRFIDSIYNAGFNAIRLPCAWDSYLENTATAKIKTSWLNRVKEVVDYCYKNNMYVIINIHWDGGWLENNVTAAKQESVKAKQKAYWEQIATYFRDYNEHLLFAGTNEPHVENAAQMAVLLSHEQTFIDAVRATGGRNAYRTLIFQGPTTDIDKTNNLMKTLPTDQVQERLMAEVHYYTPWNFCGMEKDESWGKMFYYWGSNFHNASDPTRNANYGEEAAVRSNFNKMKTQFVSKGIPVILGEYGAIRRSNLSGEALEKHLASRAFYLEYVTQQAKNYGLVPFYWDNGHIGNNGFGLFYRSTGAIFDKQALDAIIKGAGSGVYPF